MAGFRDTKDRLWEIHVDAPTIRRVRDAFQGLDLADAKGTLARDLIDPQDPLLPCDLLWFLCKRQAAEYAVAEDEFYLLVVGDTIEQGVNAILEAVTDFTPPRKRELLRIARDKDANIRATAQDAMLAKLNDPRLEQTVLEQMNQQMEAELVKALTQLSSVTNSPDSSAASPTAAP